MDPGAWLRDHGQWLAAALAAGHLYARDFAEDVAGARALGYNLLGAARLVKGHITMPESNPTFEAGLAQLHGALKFGVKVLPGTTAEEKSAAVDAWFDPLLKGFMTEHGVPETLNTAIVSLFNILAAALVAAEFATEPAS